MTTPRLHQILLNLSRPIPPPRADAPVPRKTWKKLQAGAKVRLVSPLYLPALQPMPFPAGTPGVVESTDSQGMWVRLREEYRVRWTEEWEGTFERVRKSKRKEANP